MGHLPKLRILLQNQKKSKNKADLWPVTLPEQQNDTQFMQCLGVRKSQRETGQITNLRCCHNKIYLTFCQLNAINFRQQQ